MNFILKQPAGSVPTWSPNSNTKINISVLNTDVATRTFQLYHLSKAQGGSKVLIAQTAIPAGKSIVSKKSLAMNAGDQIFAYCTDLDDVLNMNISEV